MSRELMVVLIVAIAMIAGIVRARYRYAHRDMKREHESRLGAGETRRLLDEVRQLRERVSVLERITVEKENSLERQIEELRDR